MRYVIIGQYESKGVIGDDSSDLSKYYELGWESTCSNILANLFLNEGKISANDTIVTTADRMFFYSKVFKNVIEWNDFKIFYNKGLDEIYHLPQETFSEYVPNPEIICPKIVCNYDLREGISEILNIKDYFGIYCIRLREHCAWRNSDTETAKRVITGLRDKFGFQMFLTGKNSESLAEDLGTLHLSLREFASLTNEDNCRLCISPLSGLIQLSNFAGHANLHNFIFDHNHERITNSHPLYMGDNVNYKKVKNIFIAGRENESMIYNLFDQLQIIDSTHA
jgi:hypothetical protein